MTAKSHKDENKQVTVNKKVYRNYDIISKLEAGISLVGSEVKSLRAGQADLSGSYARIENGQCWLVGANIALYTQAGIHNHEPTRRRKLLIHKSEIRKITTKLEQRGFTLVPLRIYFNTRGLAKVELALTKGKQQYDKRQTMTKRQQRKDVDKDTKKYRR